MAIANLVKEMEKNHTYTLGRPPTSPVRPGAVCVCSHFRVDRWAIVATCTCLHVLVLMCYEDVHCMESMGYVCYRYECACLRLEYLLPQKVS